MAGHAARFAFLGGRQLTLPEGKVTEVKAMAAGL